MGDTVLRSCLLAALLTGCGNVANKTIDAGPADAGIDADLSADATIITQTALAGGKIGDRAGSIDVVSTLPNNTVLATATTDANGSATIKVYPGGSVTAIYKHTVDMGADLITWAGVKPGDTLTFSNRSPSTLGQTNKDLGAVNYSWPALTGATSFAVFSSCASNGAAATATALTVHEFSLCHRDPMDVFFFAFGSTGLIGYSFRSNVTFSDGVAVSIGAWTTTLATGMINITGLPPEITSVSGSFQSVLDSNREINEITGYNGSPTGGAFSGSFSWHNTGERTVGQVTFSQPGFSGIEIFDSFSASTLTQTIAAPAFPPKLQSGAIGSSALRTASWFLVPSAASTHDGVLLHASWTHVISGTGHPHQWDFILPPGTTSIDFPALPAQFNDTLPQPQDGMSTSVRVFDISSITGYDMLRTVPSANIMCLTCSVAAGDFQRVVVTP